MSAGSSPSTSRVADLGEHALIKRIRARVPPAPSWVAVGIGDDAAVLEPARGRHEVLTNDAIVDGVHIQRRFRKPADNRHKPLA
ncbi:MAG: hypothetical protein QGG24_06325, partial [Vicinamibacterales bacterium]|nr:hypothetical protein [Vicinamibacterales bacterium]